MLNTTNGISFTNCNKYLYLLCNFVFFVTCYSLLSYINTILSNALYITFLQCVHLYTHIRTFSHFTVLVFYTYFNAFLIYLIKYKILVMQ